MSSAIDILEIPVNKTRDVDDLVKWFEKKKVYEKAHPTITLPEEEKFPEMVLLGLVLVIGMALLILEEKGKLKVKASASKKTPKDFLTLLKNSKTESAIEKHIECRYNLDLKFRVPYRRNMAVSRAEEYSLNDVFGIWKGKKINLDKVREEQWGKRK
jgi:hypothetical protein